MVQIGIIGRLGADATSEDLSGIFVIRFNVCTNVQKKQQDGTYSDSPQWYKVSYFCRSTGVLPYLTKGACVFVSGEPLIETYTSKNTGAVICSAQITANKIELIGRRKEGENGE